MENVKTNVININPTRKEIVIEVPSERVQKEYEKILSNFCNRVKIKGFRKGKAPTDIVEKVYKQDILNNLTDSLIPEILREEYNSNDINPSGEAVIKKLSVDKGKPLNFTVEVDVWPDFSLPDYKKIKITKKEAEVKTEEIEENLERLRQQAAGYIPVEGRGVKENDYVIVEIQGKDMETKRMLPRERATMLAGHPENEKALNENIMGMKQGESKTFIISYPREHSNKRLAGKEIEYSLKVETIKEKKVPELNDEFAKEIGSFKDINELKKKIETELLESKKREADKELGQEILEKIQDQTQIYLPENAVERETLSILRQIISSGQHQRLDKKALETLKEEARKRAERNLKNNLILLKIANEEKISVSEEDLREEYKKIAQANNLSPSQVRMSLQNQGKEEDLRHNLLLRKTVDFLVESAIIK